MRKDVNPLRSLVDRRVVDRNIRKGIVTREEYQKFLDSLVDVAGNAEVMRARLGEEEEDLTDDEDDLDDEDDDDDDDDDDEEEVADDKG